MIRSSRATLGALLVAATLACGGDGGTRPRTDTTPAKLEPRSAASVTAPAGAALPDSVTVKVLTTTGTPASGVTVTFAAAAGSGTVSPATTTTNAQGVARALWTLAPRLGAAQSLEVRVGTLAPATFTATPTLPVTATIAAASADVLRGTVGAALAAPAAVIVKLPDGRPLAGATVSWSVAAGGGTVSPSTSVSGEDGKASATWTLGTTPGSNQLTASIGGASVTLHATAASAAATTLDAVSGGDQAAKVSTTLPQRLVVRARDRFGNPVAGATIDWTSAEGGSFTQGDDATDANGEASTYFTLPATKGDVHVRATVHGETGVEAGFLEHARQTDATRIYVSGFSYVGTVGAALSDSIRVRVLNDAGAAVPGAEVTFTALPGSGSFLPATVVTNGDGAAAAQWVLGTKAGRDSATVSVDGVAPLALGVEARAGAPAHVTAVSGGGQSVTAGETLPDPLVARVTDQFGNVVSTVGWRTDAGTVRTISGDASGNVRATWTVSGVGDLVAWAIAGSDSASFIAHVTAPPRPRIVLTAPLSGPFTVARQQGVSVYLLDANGAPVANQTINWRVTAGGGAFNNFAAGWTPLTTTTTTTSSAGWAGVDWYLGKLVGENTFVATAPGADSLVVTVQSVADQTCTMGIDGVAYGQNIGTGMVGTVLPNVLRSYAYDTWGNPTDRGTVPSVPDGGGTVRMDDGSFRIKLGTRAGKVTMTYYGYYCNNGGTPNGYPRQQYVKFYATATPAAASALAVASGDNQAAVAGSTLPASLVARVTDAYGNGVAGVTVTWAVTAGGGTITASSVTDSEGRASAQWKLGSAPGSNTATATVDGLTPGSVTFTATGT